MITFNIESFEDKLKRKALEKVPVKKKISEKGKTKETPIKPLTFAGPIKRKPKNPLQTVKWKTIRSEVIAAYGKVCMKCKCEPEDRDLHVDHIKPKSKYPELIFNKSNLQILCKDCNFEKSNKNETDYRSVDKFKTNKDC